MALVCNINRAGRIARALYGLILLIAGAAAIVWWWPPNWWQWLMGAGLVLGGSFALVEARLSWCVIRAMGIRTPI